MTFAASQGDVRLLVDDKEFAENESTLSCPNSAQTFSSDEDYNFFPGTNIYTWEKDLVAGEGLYISAFSLEGETNFAINTEVTADIEQ